jgi:hypothetical protein
MSTSPTSYAPCAHVAVHCADQHAWSQADGHLKLRAAVPFLCERLGADVDPTILAALHAARTAAAATAAAAAAAAVAATAAAPALRDEDDDNYGPGTEDAELLMEEVEALALSPAPPIAAAAVVPVAVGPEVVRADGQSAEPPTVASAADALAA